MITKSVEPNYIVLAHLHQLFLLFPVILKRTTSW